MMSIIKLTICYSLQRLCKYVTKEAEDDNGQFKLIDACHFDCGHNNLLNGLANLNLMQQDL